MRLNKLRALVVGCGAVAAVVGITLFAMWWLRDVGQVDTPTQAAAIPKTAPLDGEAPVVSSILVWALLGSLILTAASLIVSVRLVYWRKALQGGQTSIVPDQLLADFARYTEALRDFTKNQKRQLDVADAFRDKVAGDIKELKEALSVFTDALNKKDAEINRLRKGGDAIVYQRFLLRFLRLNAAFEEEVRDLTASGKEADTLTELHELLEDALLECGVERLVPSLGSSYSNEFGVADNPEVIKTDNKEQHLQIAEVLRPGFMIKTAGAPICLQPAHVSIYRFADPENPA